MKVRTLLFQTYINRGFDFILFSSIFIAVCAVLMSLQTYYLFRQPVNYHFLGFVLTGSLCSYNFHWFFTPISENTTPKNKWSSSNKKLHLVFFIAGLVASVFFFFQLQQYWLWILSTAIFTFLYSAPKLSFGIFKQLKRIAVGKTIFLAFAWMHITCILPLVLSGIEWDTAHYLFVIHRFFFIYSICIIFDYRDRENDKAEGIISMITKFNPTGINVLFWSSMLVSLITLACLYFHGFSRSVLFAFFIPMIIVGLLYNPSKKSKSDYLYYFILDGLMMFSFLLLLVFGF